MKHNILLFVLLGIATGCGGLADEQVGSQAQACGSASDDIITQDHFVTVSNGATLHVVEKYSPSALRHGRRRAILMLPATLVTTALWNADVPGRPEFNALEQTARAGFISYTLDYEGYGQSSHPADGKTVDFDRLVDDAGDLVQWIRRERHVPKVDLMGSSIGSTVAVALGSTQSPIPRHWIGGIVLTANIYKIVSPMLAEAMLNPQMRAFLENAPGGYVPTGPENYVPVVYATDPAVFGWALGKFPGTYAVGPTLEGFDLPIFDAHPGRAPMLQFWGDGDLMAPFEDAQLFQSEYGGPHALVTLHGGGHAPYFESVRDQFWANTFAFLEGDSDPDFDD
jgi:alpha-beta hydrolase superfamily lysophospholipase